MEQDLPASDTIASREPTQFRSRRWLVVVTIVLAVVAVGSTFAALNYHRQVDRLRSAVTASRGPSSSPTQPQVQTSSASVPVGLASPPPLSMHSYDLAVVGQRLPVTVYFTTASTDGGDSTLGQLLITALVRSGRPGVTYSLNGGDCDTNSSVVWAQGVADATGTALLTGKDWTLPKADQYTFELDASPSATTSLAPRRPGMEGEFVLGQASRYDGTPCS